MILLRARPIFRNRPGRPVAKVSRPERAINRQAREALTSELAPVFEGLINSFRGDVDNEIRQTIAATGQLGLPVESLAAFSTGVEEELREVLERAISAGSQIGLRFSGVQGIDVSPELARQAADRFIRTSGSTQIRQINQATTRSVRRLVAQVQRDDLSPLAAANKIGQRVGLTDNQQRSLGLFEERLVAQRIPTPEADTQFVRESIAQDVENRRDRMVRQRGELIVENEVALGIQEGEREFWEEAIRNGEVARDRLFKRWFTVQDPDVCPICRPLNGQVKRFDESFSSLGFLGPSPPAHLRCRCFLEYGPDGNFEQSGEPPPLRPMSEQAGLEEELDPGVREKINALTDVTDLDTLRPNQKDAISGYTGSGYVPMNKLLRFRALAAQRRGVALADVQLEDVARLLAADDGRDFVSRAAGELAIERIGIMDEAFDAVAGLQDDLVLYRGATSRPERFGNFKVGFTFDEPGFGSWSVDRETIALDFASDENVTVFRVRRRRGSKLMFNRKTGEAEFIARPQTRYTIVAVEEDAVIVAEGGLAPEDFRRRVVTLEVVD